MTREMNKPDWCRYKEKCSWWQVAGGRYCQACPDLKPKERVLNPDIKEFFENCCRMEKIER